MSGNTMTRRAMLAGVAGAAVAMAAPARAAGKQYGPGASDTEIRIGNTCPYSGPASAFSVMGLTHAAYFRMLNEEQGGVNGRKVTFISYDDAYSPPKAVEQTRKLVENDEVLLMFNTFGSPSNTAIQRYLNAKKVPQLFVASGASKFNDPARFPWTMGFQTNTRDEAAIYAQFIRKEKPDAKVAVLYQNDDFGKDYLHGLRDAFGADYQKLVVGEVSYDVADATVDSQVLRLMATGADTLLSFSTPKFGAQTIRKLADLNWKPMHLLCTSASSTSMVLRPAGLENAQGVISATYMMSPDDPAWRDHPDMIAWRAFMAKYMPGADTGNAGHLYSYILAQALQKVLENCGDDLTRENVMRQAASLKDMRVRGLLPGVALNTSPTDYAPVKQMQMIRFRGESWELFGDIISISRG
ncbi:ABC transporter substrate-binding protein [Camelimonas abortus]|uniref:ABC transporter substrate-binding protein n=1 Tax=Camelimonas abortus TaxID=1017184 RepID=A0ABV7LGU1_9HYPH